MRALVVSVSNRAAAGVYDDRTGPVLVEGLVALGFEVDGPEVVPDGEPVEEVLREAVASAYDVVVTSGGTGITPTDRTPEMTARVLDTDLPGIAEALRAHGVAQGGADRRAVPRAGRRGRHHAGREPARLDRRRARRARGARPAARARGRADARGRPLTAGWPATLRDGRVGLRPISRKDRAAWLEVRIRNAAWLAPWEATPPRDTAPPMSFAHDGALAAPAGPEGQLLPFVITYDDGLVGQLTVGGITWGRCARRTSATGSTSGSPAAA